MADIASAKRRPGVTSQVMRAITGYLCTIAWVAALVIAAVIAR